MQEWRDHGVMNELTDVELMELVKQGDYSAFDEIYNRYHKGIRNFLFSLTWDQDIAEDCLQEVFLGLFRVRDRFELRGKFSTYIFQIAKNQYLSHCRRRKRHPDEASLDNEGSKAFENLRASERVEPEAHLIEDYRRWKIRQAIESLPDKQKLVFVMSHFEGMKYDEISEILGVPVGTIKSRMAAAVRTLREEIRGEDGDG